MIKEITFIIPNMTETTLYINVDLKKEKERLTKEIEKLKKEHDKLLSKLLNHNFCINVSLKVFTDVNNKFNDNWLKLKSLVNQLNNLHFK